MNMTILDLCIKYALPTLSSGLDKRIVIISHNRAVWANYDENSKKFEKFKENNYLLLSICLYKFL